MEMLNEYSGLFSLIAAVATVVAIFVSVWLSKKSSKQSSKQIDRIYKEWDKKRKFSHGYDAFLEFQDSIKRK